jgi:thiamine phosphate synthase YjbQ (UPF0047 family)
VVDNKLALGKYQGLFLYEHRGDDVHWLSNVYPWTGG